jgi:hypothetical protein
MKKKPSVVKPIFTSFVNYKKKKNLHMQSDNDLLPAVSVVRWPGQTLHVYCPGDGW